MRKFICFLLMLVSVVPLVASDTTELEAWWIGKTIKEFRYVDLQTVEPELIDTYTRSMVGTSYTEKDIEQLREQLLATGSFLSVEIIPSRVEGSADEVVLYIEFVETQKLVSLKFSGNKVATAEELLQASTLKIGELFDAQALDRAVQGIQNLYRQKGYSRVDVTPSYTVDEKTNGIQLTIAITEYAWWIGRPIKGFIYEGLVNVSPETLDDLTYQYIGKPFTMQLYSELEAKIYELSYFSVCTSQAVRGGPGNNDLIIHFSFTELPVIRSIIFRGNNGIKAKTLEDTLPFKKGDFLSLGKVDAGKQAIISLYVERGYADAAVSSSYTIEESTNMLDLTYTITEGRQSKVAQIAFEGNTVLDDSTLKKVLTIKEQSLFNAGNYVASTIAADAQAIQLAYQKRGYIDAKVADVRLEEISLETDPIRKLRVVFVIEEGEQWFFDRFIITGNTIYSDEEIENLLTMRSGSVLDMEKVQQQITKIADLYWNEGYVETAINISETRNPQTHMVTYTISITESPQAVVEEVIIRGLTKTKPYVLQRELELHAGDVFSKQKYIKSAQNLYNTGLLTDIVPSISYGTQPNSLVVTYTVTEGSQMNIGFGATFGGNVEGFPVSGFLSWSDTNLGGTGRDLDIMTELSPDSQTATITFKDDWVGDQRWSNAVNFSFLHTSYENGMQLGDGSPTTQYRDSEAYPYPFTSYEQWVEAGSPTPDSEYLMPYEYYRFSLGYSTGYTFMYDAGRLTLGLGPTVTMNRAYYDSTVYEPYDYLIGKYEEQWQFSNRLALSASWDGRDLIANPTSGYLVSENIVYSGGILGGLSNYIRSSTSASGFLKVFEIGKEKPTPGVVSLNTTVSFLFPQYCNVNGGWDWNISATKYEYLYIDGMTIARGIQPQFYYQFLWDSSLEFSMQIVENVLWGEAFISATGANDDLTSLNFNTLDWYFAAGVGVRLKIPGFPLGLYVVKNASLTEDGNRQFVWDDGPIFYNADRPGSGLKLVLAISRSIY